MKKSWKKTNIVISWFTIICNERKMSCWGIGRGFIIQMTIIVQSEIFIKRFGSIGPFSGGKGKSAKALLFWHYGYTSWYLVASV